MSGLVGVLERGSSVGRALGALLELEYRGYDSFGYCWPVEGGLARYRAVGAISKSAAAGEFPAADACIAHTRWATHGRVSEENAHPHFSADEKVAIVHNGAIDNYRQLRRQCEDHGLRFNTQSDSEVVANVVSCYYAKTRDPAQAVARAAIALKGSFVFLCLFSDYAGSVYGACYKSALAYARTEAGQMLASDQRAILPITRSVLFVNSEELIEAHIGGSFSVRGFSGDSKEPKWYELRDKAPKGGKEPFQHFMLKEIYEAPSAIAGALSIPEEQFLPVVEDLRCSEICLTGAGSSYFAAMVGQYLFGKLANRYPMCHPADEFTNSRKLTRRDHVIAVTQSGETFDTQEALRACKAAGAFSTVITNVDQSLCARSASFSLYQNAGPEVAVPGTKSIVGQIVVLFRLAKFLGRRSGAVGEHNGALLDEEMSKAGKAAEIILEGIGETIKHTAFKNSAVDHWFFVANDILYPVAQECALKFKQVSYSHAEALSAGFFKYGAISLIDERFYTAVFLPSEYHSTEAFLMLKPTLDEIKARDGKLIGFGFSPRIAFPPNYFAEYIELPSVGPHLDCLAHLIAGQLFAYFCALARGEEIDQPRGLAKVSDVR